MHLTYQREFIGSVKKRGGGDISSVTFYLWGVLSKTHISNLHTGGDLKKSIKYTLRNDFYLN
jgi:hypothetical protein